MPRFTLQILNDSPGWGDAILDHGTQPPESQILMAETLQELMAQALSVVVNRERVTAKRARGQAPGLLDALPDARDWSVRP